MFLPEGITTVNRSKGGRNISSVADKVLVLPPAALVSLVGHARDSGKGKGQWKLGDKRGLFWKVSTFKIHFCSA